MHTILKIVVIFVATFACVSSGSITIDNKTGHDVPQCLQPNGSSPCKTLSYVFSNVSLLNDSEIVLFGNYSLNQTLTVSHVEGLVIKGGGETASVIKCSNGNPLGSGFVIKFAARVEVFNIKVEYCGTSQSIRNIRYHSAVYIINGTDVQIRETSFYHSSGRGLSMHNVNGQVKVINSSFIGNVMDIHNENSIGGGGLYIELLHTSGNKANSNTLISKTKYSIKNCVFQGNTAINGEVTEQSGNDFTSLTGNSPGKGGGIHINMKGSGFNCSMAIKDSMFHGNSALWGGGIFAVFQGRANKNTLHINTCTFDSNNAALGGGALQVYDDGDDVTGAESSNFVSLDDVQFINNSGGFGGALNYISSQLPSDINNSLYVKSCAFVENSGAVGAAVYLKPLVSHALSDFKINALFYNCSFSRNQVVNTKSRLESGIMDVESFQIDFLDYVSFNDNTASAIYSESAIINILQGTQIQFVNNTAINGGAMSLHGSIFEIHPSSQVIFYSNCAKEHGGAIYAPLPQETEFETSQNATVKKN